MDDLYKNYLEHHGILNQKWGKRNGPPYPLNRESHSSAEKKTLSKSLSGKRHEEMYDRKTKSNPSRNKVREKKDFHLTDQQKKYIKIGASVAAAALVAYGGYKLSKNPKFRRLAAKGIDKIIKTPSTKEMLGKGPEIVNTKTGQIIKDSDIDDIIARKTMKSSSIPSGLKEIFTKDVKSPSIKTDFKGINPNRNQPLTDVNFVLKTSDGKLLQETNCQACSLAYEIKRRTGKEAAAKLVDTREYSREYLFNKIYKNPEIKETSVKAWKDLDSKLGSLGKGARGNLMLNTKDGNHSIAFEVMDNGKLGLFDTQIEQAFGTDSKALDIFYRASKDIKYVRTDNLEFNDIDFIKSLVFGKG